MPVSQRTRRRWLWVLIGVPVALVVLAVGGTFVYIHFISPDPAPPMTFPAAASSAESDTAPLVGGIEGSWKATSDSKVQYRVDEVLFGQNDTATGSTNAVTGDLTIAGTTVNTTKITVDMTKVSSDESQRDGQFRGRIMQTSQFPTATFELTQPIELGSVPANLQQVTAKATGKLTLHGVTKDVTFDVTARLNGSRLEVNGTIPVTFADYNISNPSGGPASVGNDGQMEFLVVFDKAT
ncbi:MAG TPA: YceI family protein [Acidimicrobiales bacterium]